MLKRPHHIAIFKRLPSVYVILNIPLCFAYIFHGTLTLADHSQLQKKLTRCTYKIQKPRPHCRGPPRGYVHVKSAAFCMRVIYL